MASIPFDDRDGFIWMNGEMKPWRDCKVHVLTHGLHYGSCVFEGVRAYSGNVFKMVEHNQRLIDSGKELGFAVPYSVEELNEATHAVLKANNLTDAYIRPVAWRGSEMMGVAAQQNRVNVAIACWEWPSYFTPEQRMKGLRLMISPWCRPAPNTAPTKAKAAGLYMICTMSKHQAEQEGYADALMYDYRGLIAEATGANIFLVIDGELHTPTPDCFLNGITRQTVIDLARRNGLTVVERHIQPEELAKAQEVFLTGTAAEVTPVASIGDWTFTPGAVCKLLIDVYDKETGKAAS